MSRRMNALSVFAALAMTVIMVGCGATATPTATQTAPTQAATTQAAQPTAAPTKAATGPTVGGKVVFAIPTEPDTLDSVTTNTGLKDLMLNIMNASLVSIDPSGKYAPYIADSWKVSDDGKTWTFALKKNVKFDDGSALTAKDFAWTFKRIKDPATKSAVAASMMESVVSVEAADDYTLKITLQAPYYAFLQYLLPIAYFEAQSEAAVTKGGDQYGRKPVCAGPYKMTEWVTGDRVVFERNPDFNWGPPAFHAGPAYIQTIEFRIIAEDATTVAGIEAGEIDEAVFEQKDLARLTATGKIQVFEGLQRGLKPALFLNCAKAPFDDVNVRQAFNLAVDKAALIKAVLSGQGVAQGGPLSPSVIGYWPEVEKLAYSFDLAKAKTLMSEAGYKANSSGMLEKDGQPLKLVLLTPPDTRIKVSEVLKEQYKALGVDIEIQSTELSILMAQMMKGDYAFATFGITAEEADVLAMLFHSSAIGGLNLSQVNDPDLDKILDATQTTMDDTKRQEAVNAAQKRIIEKAYLVPLYAAKNYVALNNRIQGAIWSQGTSTLYLNDAYVVTK